MIQSSSRFILSEPRDLRQGPLLTEGVPRKVFGGEVPSRVFRSSPPLSAQKTRFSVSQRRIWQNGPSTYVCGGEQLPRRDRPPLLLWDRAQLVVQPSPPLRRIPRIRPDVVPEVREVGLFVYSGPGVLFVRRLERVKVGAVGVVLARQRVFVFGPDLGTVDQVEVEVEVVSFWGSDLASRGTGRT